MFTEVEIHTVRRQAIAALQKYCIPLGWLLILTSMFIAGDRSRVHQIFYIFLALPTFTLMILRPGLLKPLTHNPLFVAFAFFSVYMMITLAWSPTDETALSLIRRPLYLALLLFAAGIIGMSSVNQLNQLTRVAAIVAAAAAVLSLAYFLKTRVPHSGTRLDGYGALYNPLLSAHVFGAFATYWLASWLLGPKLNNPLAIICLISLVVTLLATGSRTPLVGMTAALAWLVAVGDKRRGVTIVAVILVCLIAVLIIHPEAFTQRGTSYRPQIWLESLRQISLRPWLGHGYDAEIKVVIPGMNEILADPHNMELGVLYAGGAIGLLLWLVLYSVAFYFCWKNRADTAVSLAGAWLVFGIGSGLTEGMAFMSRPKEHWFLIWLPIALIYGQWIAQKMKATYSKRPLDMRK